MSYTFFRPALPAFFITQFSWSTKEVYPTISDRNASCIIFNGMSAADDDDSNPSNHLAYEILKEIRRHNISLRYPDLVDASDINAVADLYADGGTSGTRNPDCN